jgi:hypothetical protein
VTKDTTLPELKETPLSQGAYYVSSAAQFLQDARNISNVLITLKQGHNHYRPKDLLSDEQVRAWESSIRFIRGFLKRANLTNDQAIALEAVIRGTRQGIDLLIAGESEAGKKMASLLELKTWHTSRKSGRKYDLRPQAETIDCTDILVSLHTYADKQTKQEIVSREVQQNPRLQVKGYAHDLRQQINKAPNGIDVPGLSSCVVLYNCTQLSQLARTAFENALDEKTITNIPLITKAQDNLRRS